MTQDTNSENKPQTITLQYTPGAQDWPDPIGTDNAMNQCSLCRWMFWGHKGRVVCRTCTEKAAREQQPQTSAPLCRKCNTPMQKGQAIPTALVTMDEGTISEGSHVGAVPLAEVWKCPSCGHSFQPAPMPWAAEREHFAKGGKIDCRHWTSREKWSEWYDVNKPSWLTEGHEYRIHPEDLTPDRCPTCGSATKDHSHPVNDGIPLPCGDAWHNTPSDAAPPAPEPWRPRFKKGDPVILKFDRQRPNCRIVRESTDPGDQAGIQWGNEGEWWNKSSVLESEIEPYVWTMPTPPVGHEWHRNDFTEPMLPPGTRPLCKGEMPVEGKDECSWMGKSEWEPCRSLANPSANQVLETWLKGWYVRTTRPAPTPPQAEPTAQTAGEAAYISYQTITGESPSGWSVLHDMTKDLWNATALAVLDFAGMSPTKERAELRRLTEEFERLEKELEAAQPSRTEREKAEQLNWAFVLRTLKECQKRLECGGMNRQSWIDPAIDLAAYYSRLEDRPARTDDAGKIEMPTTEQLADIVRQHLTSVYHCTRVWFAWSVGTMTKDDFQEATESGLAEEIASAVREACMRAMEGGSGVLSKTLIDQEGLLADANKTIADLRKAAQRQDQLASVLSTDLQDCQIKLDKALRDIAKVEGEKLALCIGTETNIANLRRENASIAAEKEQAINREAEAIGALTRMEESNKTNYATYDEAMKRLESDLTAARESISQQESTIRLLEADTENERAGRLQAEKERDEARESLRKVEGERDQLKDQLSKPGPRIRGLKAELERTKNERDDNLLRVQRMAKELASLKASSGWEEKLRAVLMLDQAFPLPEILRILGEAHDHLVGIHNCDHHGYEVWQQARDAATKVRGIIVKLLPLPTPPPSPEEGERSIITNHVNPPIPIRTHDWSAYRDGYEQGDLIGWGSTEVEAIADLKEQEGEA